MHQRKPCLSLAMILALAATGAFAAEHDQHHPAPTPPVATGTPAPTTQTMGMMQQMMMGQNGMAGHIEGRIAFLKIELKITDAQQPLWNAVADAMRANAKGMPDARNGMAMMGSAATLPDKLAMHEKMIAGHLGALRKLRTAVEPLYVTLNADQKKTADELMIGPMGIMGMRMM
jgi:hypothetical protein